ncbi:MAG: hypothetical protein N3F09_04310 [Bacteroidia bacterium]|nr:hypothetical protein [Bacteroidia bacterium]
MKNKLKITLLLLMASTFSIFADNPSGKKKNFCENEIVESEFKVNNKEMAPRVIHTFRGRAWDLGVSNGVWTIWCQPAHLVCVQIVEHDDESLWAYIYLNVTPTTSPISDYSSNGEFVYLNVE